MGIIAYFPDTVCYIAMRFLTQFDFEAFFLDTDRHLIAYILEREYDLVGHPPSIKYNFIADFVDAQFDLFAHFPETEYEIEAY